MNIDLDGKSPKELIEALERNTSEREAHAKRIDAIDENSAAIREALARVLEPGNSLRLLFSPHYKPRMVNLFREMNGTLQVGSLPLKDASDLDWPTPIGPTEGSIEPSTPGLADFSDLSDLDEAG